MSELEKAKQIAAEAFNFKSKAYTTIEQQNEIIKVNRKAFMQILSLSSLTIPKSIAEQADKIAYYALKKEGAEEFHQWFDYKQDEYMDVVFAYLNPLTRDLVKVVEG